MARRILPHAPSVTLDKQVLAVGEVVYDETTKRLRLGDGATPGGAGAGGLNVEKLTPEQFGAVGDGVTDDTAAFRALSAYVNLIKSAVIELAPKAVYISGYQEKNGSFYLFGGYSLFFKDCDNVVVYGNGATIKVPNGMKYGAFDPATGLRLDTKAPYYDPTGGTYADVGLGLFVWNCTKFRLYGGLTFDGNVYNLNVGGEVGDIGRQNTATGAFIRDCQDVYCEGLWGRNNAGDGFMIAQYGLPVGAAPRPHTFVNCGSDTTGRNGISVLGGNSVTFINGGCRNSGLVVNNRLTFGTAPGSGVDVEAEGGSCRNIRFEGFDFGVATGNTFVADSGDTSGITFRDCTFNGIFWSTKAYTRAVGCTFHGALRRLAGGVGPDGGGALLQDCVLHGNRAGDLVIDSQGSGPQTLIRCGIFLEKGGFNLRGSTLESCSVTVTGGTDNYPDGTQMGYLEGATLIGRPFQFIVSSPTGKDPAGGYTILTATNDAFTMGRAVAGAKAYWIYVDPNFTGSLYAKSVAQAAVSNTTSATTFAAFQFNYPLARVGDRVACSYSGTVNGVIYSASVISDDQVAITYAILPGGSLGAGNFKLRLAKEAL